MDVTLSNDTIVAVITIIAPGYFAVQSYGAVNAKPEKNFSRTLVESIAIGFLLAGCYGLLVRSLFGVQAAGQQLQYLLPLFVVAPLIGVAAGHINDTAVVRTARQKLRLPGPDDDYLRVLFKGIRSSSYVTVELKNGSIFSGTPEGWSTLTPQTPQRIYFNNIAWFRQTSRRKYWEERGGSLVITTDEILYTETGIPISNQ